MPFAPFDGEKLHYFEHGAEAGGVPLVLVHGAGGTYLHWPSEARRLPEAHVCALDLPGHGQSSGGASSSVAEKARAVIGLLDHLGAPRAVIGGHSMGGAIAQTLALDCPERVAGLALVGTSARLRVAPEILEKVAADFPGAVDLVVSWMFGPAAPESLRRVARERMLEVDPQVLLGDWSACDGFDVRERLGEIRAPAIVVGGGEDRLTPEKHMRYLAEHIPGAELHLLPGSGHMVMLEQPQAVAGLVTDFLRRL